MYNGRVEAPKTEFLTVHRMGVGGDSPSGDGRYELRLRDGKTYYAIVVDRKIRQAWAKTGQTLKVGGALYNFVAKSLRARDHIDLEK